MSQSNKLSTEILFSKALELSGADRSRFIDDTCGEDNEMAARIRRLLKSHEDQPESFILNQPVFSDDTRLAIVSESVGDQIGRYKLLEQIGEGGMGVVYMAEQVEGVRRRVALKIIKLGLDTKQVIGRFEAERQAMSLFSHPNITKVLDAGSTETGRPYFVMELVRGQHITHYCRQNQMTLEQRLRLFADVCSAIQHAHQKGIIHRDLKPSNILVTQFDGNAVPKVIDFGIAKAIGQQRLTEKTVFTRFSAMIGTPQYMSPEQAELNGSDVDTRSDIYSLGVILYELITGTTPISSDALNEASPLALHETLVNARMESPTVRLGRIASDPEKKKDLQGQLYREINKRNGRYNNELDWIAMKALSVDRSQRYASANELAQDVERYLERRPVLASPQTRAYKLRSYFNRHRKRILTAAAIASLLIATSIGCIVLAIYSLNINHKLEHANSQLMSRFEELKAAKEQIQHEADEKLFSSSISIARARFDMEIQEQVFQKFARTRRSETLNSNELALGGSGDVDCTTICFCFDDQKLLELPFKGQLQPYLKRVEKRLSDVADLMEQAYETSFAELTIQRELDFPLDSSDLPESNVSESCLDAVECSDCIAAQRLADELVDKQKPQFFRGLVFEYRKAFGESSPNVAEALMMLASSLYHLGNDTEARAHLREAILIADPERAEVARNLLSAISR